MKLPALFRKAALASVPGSSRGFWPFVLESFPGAWQRNVVVGRDEATTHPTVFACVQLISGDIGKLRPRVVVLEPSGVWTEERSPAFSPVLHKPNPYQTRQLFWSHWMASILLWGNCYALKIRDQRGVVTSLHVLDPSRVRPMVADDDGAVYYQVSSDNLTGVTPEGMIVPAREIIHDRINCFFHPLVGISPLHAASLAVRVGLEGARGSAAFFSGNFAPSGILKPGAPMPPDAREAMRAAWEGRFGPGGKGGVAVLPYLMDYQGIRMPATDAQLIEQLKWSDEKIASAFGVPAFKVGVGAMPTYQNGEILDQRYYSDCLQAHIERIELALDEGLGLDGRMIGVEFDLRGLIRMDTAARIKSLTDSVAGGIMTPNEARLEMDLPPITGGDTVYLQQQYYSLEALAARDETPPAPPAPPEEETAPELPPDQLLAIAEGRLQRFLPAGRAA